MHAAYAGQSGSSQLQSPAAQSLSTAPVLPPQPFVLIVPPLLAFLTACHRCAHPLCAAVVRKEPGLTNTLLPSAHTNGNGNGKANGKPAGVSPEVGPAQAACLLVHGLACGARCWAQRCATIRRTHVLTVSPLHDPSNAPTLLLAFLNGPQFFPAGGQARLCQAAARRRPGPARGRPARGVGGGAAHRGARRAEAAGLHHLRAQAGGAGLERLGVCRAATRACARSRARVWLTG